MGIQINSHRIEVEEGVDEAIRRSLIMIGMKAEDYAKQYEYRVDTGRLRNSITSEVNKDAQEVYIGTTVEYAPYIEFGARGLEPVNFLRKSGENHMDEYRNIVRDALDGKL